MLLALFIDQWIGEPPPRWHPVVWMGNYLGWAGRWLQARVEIGQSGAGDVAGEFVDKVYDDEFQSKGIFVLKGFAGTGKTYTLSTIVNRSNFKNILVVAPTVMARMVLQTKLPAASRNRDKNVNYSTLSKLIQVPKEVITVMNTKFILNTEGITDLKNLLSRMKI